ncbi:MAG TPA: hypothetical protein VF876_00205 [Burkholderiales bacterium]
MQTARHEFDPLQDPDRYVRILAGARGAADVVATVRDYLAAWPRECVANMQRVDGGWAPFDANQQPMPLYRPADVHKICDSVRGQCASLQGAGVVPSPELLALDTYLFLASVKLTEFELEFWTRRPPVEDRQPNPRAYR